MPYCTILLLMGSVLHQKCAMGAPLSGGAGAEARICKKRDAIFQIGSPNLIARPQMKSTRRAFSRFHGRFMYPPNHMVILHPTALQAKLLVRSVRRRGGGARAACELFLATNKTKHYEKLFECLYQSTLPARGQARGDD